jgi:hypothetical protein
MSKKAPEFVPSVNDYIKAFKKIEAKITPKQLDMLVTHYEQVCHVTTARDLALIIGYEDFQATNLWYGKLGSLVADAMGIEFRGVSMLVLMVPPQRATNAEWLWVLRANIVTALEEMKWVEKQTHLFNGPRGSSRE